MAPFLSTVNFLPKQFYLNHQFTWQLSAQPCWVRVKFQFHFCRQFWSEPKSRWSLPNKGNRSLGRGGEWNPKLDWFDSEKKIQWNRQNYIATVEKRRRPSGLRRQHIICLEAKVVSSKPDLQRVNWVTNSLFCNSAQKIEQKYQKGQN